MPAGDYAVTAAAEGANTTTSTTASYVGNLIGVTATGQDPTGAEGAGATDESVPGARPCRSIA